MQQNELIKNLVNYKDFIVLDNKTVSYLIIEAINKINNIGR